MAGRFFTAAIICGLIAAAAYLAETMRAGLPPVVA
jgi:ABC-type amino acid transport system permease subunit